MRHVAPHATTLHTDLCHDLAKAKLAVKASSMEEKEWREAEIAHLEEQVRETDPRFYHPTFFSDQF